MRTAVVTQPFQWGLLALLLSAACGAPVGPLDTASEPPDGRDQTDDGDNAAASAHWAPAAPMSQGRGDHTATLLNDGRLLVSGGSDGVANMSTTELYDPEAEVWEPASPMLVVRSHATAVLLPNGKVLVAGGNGPTRAVASAELYDPETATWSFAASMKSPRQDHVAALLDDGRVLVAGGYHSVKQGNIWVSVMLASAEVYDPVVDAWSAAGAMTIPRNGAAGAKLLDGRVIVASGYRIAPPWDPANFETTAEVYDPATNAWSVTGPLSVARLKASATLLRDGRVLLAGGFDGVLSQTAADLYDPVTNTWSPAAPMSGRRAWTTGVVLDDGHVLIAGGLDMTTIDMIVDKEIPLTAAERYDADLDTWTPARSLVTARTHHTLSRLANGRILAAGGWKGPEFSDPADWLSSVESAGDRGASCAAKGDCLSGHCVQGVCCDRRCDATTCDVCTAAKGAEKDGLCTVRAASASEPCATRCQSANDCAAGLVCNEGGTCSRPSSDSADQSGCFIGRPPAANGPAGWIAALAAVLLARRRRP